ncbi:inverse autotransporter beta domain-containing protein, partial [Klebsiella pneumoniae]|uniref:inverse autotransporter beta domain-containing protein n=1 Tax=Klebsiella pneumoniae TaxID=573 RepID=UPI001E3E0A72
GAEAWGEYLRLSANYYHPLGDWQLRDNQTQEQRMAAGYDVTALKRGADGYLLKDMEPEDLLKALQQAAAGEMVLSEALTPV